MPLAEPQINVTRLRYSREGKPVGVEWAWENVIYLIRCLICYEYYIGKSLREVKVRIQEDLRKTTNPCRMHLMLCPKHDTQHEFCGPPPLRMRYPKEVQSG